ncbi:hypothetical protein QUF80_14250 [Desulfococcaceae bacterium HSG8]|nr:hypothetical protein [Desulfococcaceae bacterium HSG8]
MGHKIYFNSLLIMGILILGILPANRASAQTRLAVGMNLTWVNYYGDELMFTDLAKTLGGGGTGYDGPKTGGWMTKDIGKWDWDTGKIGQIPLDSNGYPLELPYNGSYVHAIFSNNYPEGAYLVLYDGEGELAVTEQRGGGTYEIENKPGRIMFHLGGKKEEKTTFNGLEIRSSEKGNHIRNIRIIPENMEFTYQDNIFYQPFVDALRPFHALRFMQIQGTNSQYFINPGNFKDMSVTPTDTHTVFGGQRDWARRRKTTDFTQETKPGKAVAYEYLIQLCNEIRADAWFCIPHLADNNYILEFAKLVRGKLDSDLKVYIEYSNECWNWAWGYPQSNWLQADAPGMPEAIQNDLKPLPGFPEKIAYMHKRVFDIWLSVFTGEDRKRLIRTVGVQRRWPDNTRRVLQYLKDNAAPGDPGCDMVSPSGYFGLTSEKYEEIAGMSSVTGETVIRLADQIFETDTYTAQSAQYAKDFGVMYGIYEGGPHLDPRAELHTEAFWEAKVHPLIYDLYMKAFERHASPEVNCHIFMAFDFTEGVFGHLDNVHQLRYMENLMNIAPKFKALLDANISKPIPQGDINKSWVADISDVILSLQVLAELAFIPVYIEADVGNNGKIGLEEAIYILRKKSETK